MYERTDEEIISNAPVELTFGDKAFYVPPLPIAKGSEWNLRVNKVLGLSADQLEAARKRLIGNGNENPTQGQTQLEAMRVAVEDVQAGSERSDVLKILDLVCEYAPALLDRTIIGGLATTAQICLAFVRLYYIENPTNVLRRLREVNVFRK